MRERRLLPVFIMFALIAAVQPLLADHAYDRGYELGRRMGMDDARAGRAADFARSVTYNRAVDSWDGQGDREQYRTQFRFGFREGYNDGYREAGGRITGRGVARYGRSQRGLSDINLARDAFNNGFYAGFHHGGQDADRGYNFSNNQTYRAATHGYVESKHRSLAGYQQDFRTGFEFGYEAGYYRHENNPDMAWSRFERGERAVASGSAATFPRAGAGTAAGDEAFVIGYRHGYEEGQTEMRGSYNATDSRVYQDAVHGYNARRSRSVEEYKAAFRQGFVAGYDDGYNGRASDFRRDAPRGFGARRDIGSTGAGSVFVPSGTVIRMRLNNALSTRSSREGDRFTASVQEPVYMPNSSEVAVPSDSTVTGVVTHVERPGRVGGTAELQLRYDTLTMPGGIEYQLQASTQGVDQGRIDREEGTVEGRRSTTRDVGTVAAGAALGAIIGAIAGGGKGAGIGAAVGSAVGLGTILTTRGREIDLPAGSNMEIRLENGLELRR